MLSGARKNLSVEGNLEETFKKHPIAMRNLRETRESFKSLFGRSQTKGKIYLILKQKIRNAFHHLGDFCGEIEKKKHLIGKIWFQFSISKILRIQCLRFNSALKASQIDG